MKTNRESLPSLDEFEELVLRKARAALPQGSSGLEANLRALEQRILALPLTGLPDIEIPEVPQSFPSDAATGPLNPHAPPPPGLGSSEAASGLTTSANGAMGAAGALGGAPLAGVLPLTPWISGSAVKALLVGVTLVSGGALTVPALLGEKGTGGAASEVGAETAPEGPRNAASDLRRDLRPGAAADAKSPPALSRGPLDVSTGSLAAAPSESGLALRAPGRPAVTEAASRLSPARANATSQVANERPVATGSPVPRATSQDRTPVPSIGQSGALETDATNAISDRPATHELTALREAQRALKAGDAARALLQLRALNGVVPGGHLLPERRVTELLALCALGRSSEAQRIGAELEATESYDMYRPRLESSCAPPHNGKK